MCNVFNTCVNNRCGYAATIAQATGSTCSCGCWNGCWQRVCRDGCGNLIVRNVNQCNTCGCGCCNNSCGGSNNNDTATGNTGNGTTNTNGVFRCVTFCGYGNGNVNGNARNRSGCNCASAYYARQYGLTCDDNGECAYNFTND